MVTNAKLSKLVQRLDRLTDMLDPASREVVVACFRGEEPRDAIAKHLRRRPDHRGRKFKLEFRDEVRNEVNEMLASHSLQEIEAVLNAIDGKSGGLNGRIAQVVKDAKPPAANEHVH